MKRSTKFKRQIARAVEPSGEAPREPRRVQPAALGANVQVTADRKTASAAGGVEQQSKLAVELGELIKRTRPELYMNPRLRLPLSVAQRRVGFGREADNYLQQLARDSTHPIWRDCARTELWMGPRQGLPPKKVAQCFATLQPPRIDGQLTEAVWTSAVPLRLRTASSGDEGAPAAALLSYDRDYLYLAVICQKAPGVSYRAEPDRRRDTDLSAHDRVAFYFDVDRDYATFFELTIDDRGWANEACAGDATWDPKWGIAAWQNDQAWTAEAVIPLSELTQTALAGGKWAFGVQRIVPNHGVQAWTHPAAVRPLPAGFAVLSFAGAK